MDQPSTARGSISSRATSQQRSIARVDVATRRFQITTWSVAVTCALAPAYTIRWHLGPLPTTLLENALVLTFVIFAAECVRTHTIPSWRTAVLWPAIAFLVAGAISIVVAPDRRAALGLYRAYIIEPIAFGLVVTTVATTARRALLIAAGLGVGGLIAGVANSYVVAQALRHHAYDVTTTPPVVIYNTANAVALYLVPLIAVGGALALHWPETRIRIAAAAASLAATAMVVLSFSRGGYLALGVVAIGLAISHRRRWILLAAGAVGGAALLAIPTIRHRVFTELDLSNGHNTLVGRFHLWSVALQMLRTRPIFGAGLSGFATAIAPYWNVTNIDRYTYPHNIVLNFWTETGVLGVVAFTAILIVGFVLSWRAWRSGSLWRAVGLGVLLALAAVVVHGLVDVPYWKNDLSLEFWAIVGLVLAPSVLGFADRPTTAGA